MNIQQQLRGRFTATIISGNHEETSSWTSNLILNCGKDDVMSGAYALCKASSYCAVGTGTSTPTVEQTVLDSEIKRTNTYRTTGNGNCQTIVGYEGIEQTVTIRRGYLFPVETVDTPVPYAELGWAYGATSSLFSRALFTQPIGLKAGQQLLIVYDLIVTMTPAQETTGTLVIDGWSNPTGIMSISSQGIGYVGSNGIGDTVKRAYEPGSTVYGYVRTGTIAHPPFNAYRVGGTNLCNSAAGTWSSYSPGSFTRSISFPYTSPANGDSDAVTGLAWGTSNSELATVFAFDSVRSKSNLYKVKPNGYSITIGTPLTTDPLVNTWHYGVVSNGGSLTAGSYTIATNLVAALRASTLLNKIVYLLPLLGNNINAARVPIIDTLAVGAALNNGFVDSDFSESVGLTNDASIPKYLNSQIKPSQLGTSNNGGLGWWETNIGFGPGVEPIGCYDNSNANRFVLDIRSNVEEFRWGNPANFAQLLTTPTNGHYYGQRSSITDRTLYIGGIPVAYGNGVSDSASGASDKTIFIHGCYEAVAYYWSGTCAVAYMTDGTLSDAQVIELNTILHDNLIVPTGR